ncbi:porin [Camelimonas sp. ID_303_24]
MKKSVSLLLPLRAVGRGVGVVVAPFVAVTLSAAAAADLPGPEIPGRQSPPLAACRGHGAGFFAIPETGACVRIGGLARLDADATAPLPVKARDRFGLATLGRISVDARSTTEWGVARTFVRFGLQSLTGRSFSGGLERRAGGFGATGVDTFGRAQKGVLLDRAFVQFGGLTAGRANSFYDFYAHDAEMTAVTPASDPPPVNLLAYTFKAAGGLSLTVAAEDPTSRRTPVAFARMWGGRTLLSGGVPVALVPAGPANGAPAFALVDVRQRLNAPDLTAALRLDGDWGAAQLSGAMHQVSIGPFVSTMDPGAAVGAPVAAARPGARYGFAVQAGLMLRLPALAAGDRLWLQAAAARGAISYTGANTPAGQGSASGSVFGCVGADMAEGYVGPRGRLRLSESWSAVAAFEHYWRPDLSQSFFAGISGVSFGGGAPAGFDATVAGRAGFPRLLSGNRVRAAGTRLAWSPVREMTVAAEVAWTELRLNRPGPDLRRRLAPALRASDSGWVGKLRVERSF